MHGFMELVGLLVRSPFVLSFALTQPSVVYLALQGLSESAILLASHLCQLRCVLLWVGNQVLCQAHLGTVSECLVGLLP